MFIGDGINDSPVLAQADIGCAINSASDITVSAAGIVLIKDDLMDVLKAMLISRKSFARIKINFAFAFLYNVILIPIAMGIFYPINGFKLDPMFAAVAMAMSSISVVSSSLFLKLYNPEKDIRQMSQGKNYCARTNARGGQSRVQNNTDLEETMLDIIPLKNQAHSSQRQFESTTQLLNDKEMGDGLTDIVEENVNGKTGKIEFKTNIN